MADCRKIRPAEHYTGPEPCTAVIARTDPNEQESAVLLPELEPLVP